MGNKIRIGIAGYGNLGRGVEASVAQNPDMELVGVFTRRDPATVSPAQPETQVFAWDTLAARTGDVDVMILCGGSASDLPQQSPELAGLFNIVDSFDTHANVPAHFAAVDAPALETKHTAVISTGWDPGMFSLNRLFGEAILPQGKTYTFWGRGVSQGHSDAIRRVPGVAAGVQYTLPAQPAIEAVRNGEQPELSTREKHTRECYVVLEEGADAAAVRETIVSMPNYFADYDTTVHFISAEELAEQHNSMPHGGFVMRSGDTGHGAVAQDGTAHRQVIEYGLTLADNPSFTASVLVAYARAAYRLAQAGNFGAKTVFDIAPGLLDIRFAGELRRELL
ncbi:diaminopimelate dehydrogenase [Populibacterium corticicola]|uniref:Meso-diaminopimelate D-dehydrogenase n=1 Tax=Populibacterium corticicola TaxID=1812826 RepID=A0ABW5XEF1_9MICO